MKPRVRKRASGVHNFAKSIGVDGESTMQGQRLRVT